MLYLPKKLPQETYSMTIKSSPILDYYPKCGDGARSILAAQVVNTATVLHWGSRNTCGRLELEGLARRRFEDNRAVFLLVPAQGRYV